MSDGDSLTRIDPIDDETVELSVEVDVSNLDASQTRNVERMATLFEANFRTYVAKNEDYGDSYVKTGHLEAGLDGGPFDSAPLASLYHLWIRASDKHHRAHTLLFGDGGTRVDESAVDTMLDAANYYFLMALTLDSVPPRE